MDSAKRVISGTWGELWLDGEYVAECYALQLKASYNKETIQLTGQMAEDAKVTSIKNTGSVELYHVNSRMIKKLAEIKNGRDVRCTIISKLDDPDAYGAERVKAENVSFDDLTLADWKVAATGSITAPFTFTDYAFLDEIEVEE